MATADRNSIATEIYRFSKVVDFSEFRGFDFISTKNEQRHTRQMFFDLNTCRSK